jgi:predicted DCC family thiol-disulfide oxidoreductase YuxK
MWEIHGHTAAMRWVLFFDGDCGFCSESVRLIAGIDKAGQIDFAPLRGKLGTEMGLEKWADPASGSVVLLRESDGQFFYFSDACLEVAGILGGGWRIFRVLRWIPKPLRDWVYRVIARNRYRFIRKAQVCNLGDLGLRRRLRE